MSVTFTSLLKLFLCWIDGLTASSAKPAKASYPYALVDASQNCKFIHNKRTMNKVKHINTRLQ